MARRVRLEDGIDREGSGPRPILDEADGHAPDDGRTERVGLVDDRPPTHRDAPRVGHQPASQTSLRAPPPMASMASMDRPAAPLGQAWQDA